MMRILARVVATAGFLLIVASKPVSADLCSIVSSSRYDIIYVCPQDFSFEVSQFAAHRATYSGYSTLVAKLEEIASCYGPGRDGIRSMILQAISSWTEPVLISV